MKLLFNEIKRFLKKYFKVILSISILLTAIFTTLYVLNYNQSTEENQETGTLFDPHLYDGNAYFAFYIEDENQEAFTNTVLLNQYLRLDETIERITAETNTSLAEEYNDQVSSLLLDPLNTIPVIEIRRDSQSHLITLYVRLEDQEDNLQVAEYLLERLENQEIPVLENKEFYLFQEAEIFNEHENAAPSNIFSVLSIKDVLLVATVLAALSLIFVTVITLLKEMFNDRLAFSFTYTTDEATDFMIFNSEADNRYEVQEFLSAPGNKKKLLISESEGTEGNTIHDLFKMNAVGKREVYSTTFYSLNKIENITESENIYEIIILVVSGETSRKWFNKQKRIASLYNKPVKVLQINH